jgi:hypothetical protein
MSDQVVRGLGIVTIHYPSGVAAEWCQEGETPQETEQRGRAAQKAHPQCRIDLSFRSEPVTRVRKDDDE